MAAEPIPPSDPAGATAHMDPKQANIVYHDWEAGTYDDKWSISFDERCIDYAVGRFRRVVPGDERFENVLEVGCGTGFFLLNLAQAGIIGNASCTDISPGRVAQCVENGRRLGIDVNGEVADAEALPYDDDSFDLVIGHAVIHHLPNLPAAFSEFHRVLKPGGRLVIAGEPTQLGDRVATQVKRAARISVKLAAAAFGADTVLADPMRDLPQSERDAAALETVVDLHIFTPAEVEALAVNAGFSDVSTVTEELTANWFGWFTRTVEAMVKPELIPARYPWFAYRTWQRLFAFDEAVMQGLAPKELFYNCILSAKA